MRVLVENDDGSIDEINMWQLLTIFLVNAPEEWGGKTVGLATTFEKANWLAEQSMEDSALVEAKRRWEELNGVALSNGITRALKALTIAELLPQVERIKTDLTLLPRRVIYEEIETVITRPPQGT